MIPPIALGPLDLALAAALVLLNAGVSAALQLGMGRRLLVASARAIAQLLLLGFVLQRVFVLKSPWAVLGLMLAMGLVAGWEATRRPRLRVPGMARAGMVVMLTSSMLVTLYTLVVILGTEPWWRPQYAVPILGMILGNTLNGISLGLETALEGFDRERTQVELLLAHGASRAEASRDVVRRAVRTGLVPILNSMLVAGVVSIPGMMTGQILAGQDPNQAARYQIVILFCIAGAVALGTLGVVFATTRLMFDDRDRLRLDRLTRRDD